MLSSNTSSHPQNSTHRHFPRSSSVLGTAAASNLRPGSRAGSRAAAAPVLAHSPPNEVAVGSRGLNKPSTLPDSVLHSSGGHRRSSSGDVKDGVGNLNRWSQSTASSKGSFGHARKLSFSNRLSIAGSGAIGSLDEITKSTSSPPSRKVLTKPRPPIAAPSKRISTAPSSATTLPTILTLPALSEGVDVATSSSHHALSQTSTAGPSEPKVQDYFGDTWKLQSSPQDRSPGRDRRASRSDLLGNSNMHAVAQRSRVHGVRSPEESFRYGDRERSGSVQTHRERVSQDVFSQLSVPFGISPSVYEDARTRSPSVSNSYNLTGSTRKEKEREKDKSKDRSNRLSQKAMLSKALQKANTAVLLDNAHNFEGAMEAYEDACRLLQQVMSRTNGDDDRRKLEAIRTTYVNRITELRNLEPRYQVVDGKALPERPESISTSATDRYSKDSRDTRSWRASNDGSGLHPRSSVRSRSMRGSVLSAPSEEPYGGESFLPNFIDETEQFISSATIEPAFERARLVSNSMQQPRYHTPNLQPPFEMMPPPLSPRRPLTPNVLHSPEESTSPEQKVPDTAVPVLSEKPFREVSGESTSWLNTIEESGSDTSSMHSRSSSMGLRRKKVRPASGATEAEFDRALDAAVEAAYDDGYEPAEYSYEDGLNYIAGDTQETEERIQQVDRELAELDLTRSRYIRIEQTPETQFDRRGSLDLGFAGNDDEAEEEERILDEVARDYDIDGFGFDVRSKNVAPRESDSSGFSNRTYGSSIVSNPTTAATSLQTIANTPGIANGSAQAQPRSPPPHPPPAAALPPPPSALGISPPPLGALPGLPPMSGTSSSSTIASPKGGSNQSVRNRRISGQNSKPLKIETFVRSGPPPPQEAPPLPPMPLPSVIPASPASPPRRPDTRPQVPPAPTMQLQTSLPLGVSSQPSSAVSGPSPADTNSSVSPLTGGLSRVTSDGSESSRPLHKTYTGLRKNMSSSSLKNRNLSVSSPDGSDTSITTPMSSTFSSGAYRRAYTPSIPPLPTPSAALFLAPQISAGRIGGFSLFETNIHSPTSPGSPNNYNENAPAPLEPCPVSDLLRPFWLMRCIYQTIAHQKGGYLSTNLFVPRDIWTVRNVKLKAVEDKVANCDLLTAALLKLNRVDTFDADAVLEEMQSFENLLDQVQTTLSKKLGNDVGVQGALSTFKDAPQSGTALPNDRLTSKSTNSSTKSYFGFRKLRSKNSGSEFMQPMSHVKEGLKDAFNMRTVPLTSLPSIKFVKRDANSVQTLGPYANYMGSLARLCDAAQILDSVARQAEDKGLQGSSPTHVGIELSARHAAEFFAFYICRFILNDVGLLLDKYVKRGTEWVML